MDHAITSIDKIEREARAAALKYATVAEACPYPFSTAAGRVFRAAFLGAKGLCECITELTPQELDNNRCQCCAKALA